MDISTDLRLRAAVIPPLVKAEGPPDRDSIAQPFADWRIVQDASDGEVEAFLLQDRVWNCFALADLKPPLRAYSQFALAYRRDVPQASCLILRHPIIGEVLSPFGNGEGVAALLQQIEELPAYPLIQAQEAHITALQQRYRAEPIWRGMWRMAVTAHALCVPAERTPQPIRQLTQADLPALQQMYDQQSEVVFSAELFPQSLFFGASDGARMSAAGGTHALTPAYQVAVLGHILTAPEARRQGYASAITATLASTLLHRQFSTIVLNVFADNQAAIRVYERLGFQAVHKMVTGRATLLT